MPHSTKLARSAPVPPVDPASAAASAALSALHAGAVAAAEAKYTAGPGARKRPRPAGSDGERRARKTRSAYLSRFTAAEYTAALEAAYPTADAERMALETQAERAKEEQRALRLAVARAENELLRRQVAELQSAIDGESGKRRGGVVLAAEDGSGRDAVTPERAPMAAPERLPAESPSPREATTCAESCALPCSPMSVCVRVGTESGLNAESDAEVETLFDELLLAKDGDWESFQLPDLDISQHFETVAPITAA